MEYKLVVLVRMDLELPKGKLAAQVAHAAVECAFESDQKTVAKWRASGAKKIVLKVKNEKEMLEHMQIAEDAELQTSLITDAGHTVVEPGTRTCVGIGPDAEDKIDKVTGKLKML